MPELPTRSSRLGTLPQFRSAKLKTTEQRSTFRSTTSTGAFADRRSCSKLITIHRAATSSVTPTYAVRRSRRRVEAISPSALTWPIVSTTVVSVS